MSLRPNQDIPADFALVAQEPQPRQLPDDLHRLGLVRGIHQLDPVHVLNMVLALLIALPAAYAFSRYSSSVTTTCSSGC